MPLDLTSRQENSGDPDDYRNRTGNPRFSPVDTGKKSPSHLHHSSFPPGPTPAPYVPSSMNTYADNGSRAGQDHQRPVPRDPLASPSSRDEDLLRGREAPIYLLQTKVSSPAHVEEAHAGKKSPNHMHHNILSPPTDQIRNPSAICDATGEAEGLVDMRTRNTPANVNVNIRQKSPTADSVAEGARYRQPSADMTRENFNTRQRSPRTDSVAEAARFRGLSPDITSDAVTTRQKSPPADVVAEAARSGQPPPDSPSEDFKTGQKLPTPESVAEAARYRRPSADTTGEGANNRARERQGTPEAEDDRKSFSPTKALEALRIQNTGPLYKVKERQVLGPTSKFSIRNTQGSLTRGRNRSQGDEYTGTENADFGLRHDTVDPGPSTGQTREEMLGLHRRQRSDGVAISERSHDNDLYGGNPGLHAGRRWSLEDEAIAVDKFPEEPTSMPYVSENKNRVVELTVEKEKSRDNPLSARGDEEKLTPNLKSISRASSSDVARQLNETINGSTPKAITVEQGLPPASDVSLVRGISPELKALHKEKLVVNKDTFGDEDQPGALLEKEEHSPTLSPLTIRKPLSPPRFLSSKSVIGGIKPPPEHISKTRAAARQEPDAPSNLQDFHGQPDVLDYDTSEDSSNVDDAEQYQIISKPHSEELRSPTLSHNGLAIQAGAGGGNSGRSDDEDEHEPTETRSTNSRSQDNLGVISLFGPVKAGASPYRSPESSHGESPPQTQTSDQRKHELQGRQPDALELTNSFSFGQGGQVQGSAYSSLKGQTQKVRLQINTPVPERIHVRCRHCKLQLEVPLNLARSETGVQKLRCGSCWKISRFRLNHLLSPSGTSSPVGSDRSPESSFRLGSSDGTSGRYSGTRSNRETGTQDRVVLRTQSGANLPVPPSTRHNPRAASGLSNMVSVSSIPSETSKASTPNTSGDLGPAGSSPHGGKEMIVAISPSGQAEPSHTSLSPTLSSTSQDVGSKDRQQKSTTSPDRRLLQSSSDSDEEKASAQLKIGPSALNPTRMASWSAPETPEFDDGHEFKGLKGFLKKSVKELTKGKKSTQYRRKVVVNGHAVPDDVVRRAEDYAGGIHPGSYW